MTTLDVTPLFRSTAIGLERPSELALDTRTNAWNTRMSFDSASDPAYNILKLDEDEYRISVAVPGLTENEISIETREGALWVKANRHPDPDHNRYLFKGVGLDGFQRSFQLPEHVTVRGALLERGMLHIDLLREVPEELRPRRIEIETAASPPHQALTDSSSAVSSEAA